MCGSIASSETNLDIPVTVTKDKFSFSVCKKSLQIKKICIMKNNKNMEAFPFSNTSKLSQEIKTEELSLFGAFEYHAIEEIKTEKNEVGVGSDTDITQDVKTEIEVEESFIDNSDNICIQDHITQEPCTSSSDTELLHKIKSKDPLSLIANIELSQDTGKTQGIQNLSYSLLTQEKLLAEVELLRKEVLLQKRACEKLKQKFRKRKHCHAKNDPQIVKSPKFDIESDSDKEIVLETDSSDEAEVSANSSPHRPIYVRQSHSRNNRRIWDKLQCCLYCYRCCTNITKHYFTRHKNEAAVALILSIPKNSEDRKLFLERLRNRGNYHHNCKVIRKGQGEIIPWRCPPYYVPHTSYVPCKHCLGFFLKADLWKHYKSCPHKEECETKICPKLVVEASYLLPSESKYTKLLHDLVLNRMNDSELYHVVKNDPIIMRYGEKLLSKICDKDTAQLHILKKMKELARMLLACRKVNDSMYSFSDCIDPKNFRSVIEAVREVAGCDVKTGNVRVPYALRVGRALKCCSLIKLVIAYEENRDDDIERCKRFIKLNEMEWCSAIASRALNTLDCNRRYKPTILSIVEDVVTLQNYLRTQISEKAKTLETQSSKDVWSDLCKLALSSVTLFNKNRSDVGKIDFEAYKSRRQSAYTKDADSTLTVLEREICKNYVRIDISRKRGRTDPVIFTPFIIEILELLLKTREQVGIYSDNGFLFPYSFEQATTHLRGLDCVRKHALECGVKNIENIFSTKINQYVAIFSQLLNLEESELNQLATFMGHNLQVHENFNRLPKDVYRLAKVGKLLVAMKEGRFEQYLGKSFEEIDFNINENLDEVTDLYVENTASSTRFNISMIEKQANQKCNEKNIETQQRTEETIDNYTKGMNSTNKKRLPNVTNAADLQSTVNKMDILRTADISSKKRKISEPISGDEYLSIDETEKPRRAKRFLRHIWNKQEIEEINKQFMNHLLSKKLPGKHEILKLQKNIPCLQKFSWEKIKGVCRRQINRLFPL